METIGDAYMIVCGVPVKTDTHAQPVANFAMDMIEEGAQVKSPATGKPLQVSDTNVRVIVTAHAHY